jgi:hypothetical protein
MKDAAPQERRLPLVEADALGVLRKERITSLEVDEARSVL